MAIRKKKLPRKDPARPKELPVIDPEGPDDEPVEEPKKSKKPKRKAPGISGKKMGDPRSKKKIRLR